MNLIYIASPLFSKAELEFNLKVKHALEPYFNIYLPQIDGRILTRDIQSGSDITESYKRVFNSDTEAIIKCDMIVAILDGRSIDEGVAFELGYAFAKQKVCIGLQTDTRRLTPYGNNPMIECALEKITYSIEELVEYLKNTHYNTRYKKLPGQ